MSRGDAARALPLVLQEVGFARRGQTLLADVSLRFERGKRSVIMGPNGAGKSLLLRLCHGLLAPSHGRIRCGDGGSPLSRACRRHQALVFQRPVLLRRSALANITYALALRGTPWRERRRRAEEALALLELSAVAGRSARVLSGGEQQRLALARAWVLGPEVLFLDEPTSALDPRASQAVEEAIERFHAAGTKVVMTTHNVGQARRLADEVIFLSDGRVNTRAAAPAFFDDPGTPVARHFLAGELAPRNPQDSTQKEKSLCLAGG